MPATRSAGELDVTEGDLDHALDRLVAEGLPTLALGVGLLHALFVVADPFIVAHHHVQIALIDAVTAVAFLSAASYARRGLSPRHAHPLAFALAALVLVGVLHDAYVLNDPEQSLYLILLAVGAGSLMLSARWLVPLLGVTLGGFLGVAGAGIGERWTNFAMALLAACVLAFVVMLVRAATYRRLEVLRLVAEKAADERDMREQALESAVQAAWEGEERYRRLVEQAPDGFLVIREGKVAYANPAAIRLYGGTRPEDLLGRDALSLVHPDDAAAARARIAQIVDDGRATEMAEMRIVRLDGRVVDVEVMGQPIQYLGKIADQTVIRDITDRKRAAEERRLAENRLAEIARLQEMDRVKTQFVNTLSHELRTPLTPIKVQLHLMRTGAASGDKERQRKAQEMIERNFARMSGLVDELLEVARVQAGTLKLDLAPVRLDAVVADALESFVDVARESGVEVHATAQPDLVVDADAKRMTQVMFNLLNNALKFTPRGGSILVDLRAANGTARVSVTDTGVGIRPEDVARLFEPFSQVHDPMQQTNAGTGLGLYICKGIVEGHRGRIWCESEGADRGATFAFEIPLADRARTQQDRAIPVQERFIR